MSTTSTHRPRKHSVLRKRVFGLLTGTALVASMGFAGAASASPGNGDAEARQPSTMAQPCPEGWLCVWDEANGQGNRKDFYTCEFVDLRGQGPARVGSFINNQTDGTVATFYGLTPDGLWYEQYTSSAFDFRDNDGGSHTYGIRVC